MMHAFKRSVRLRLALSLMAGAAATFPTAVAAGAAPMSADPTVEEILAKSVEMMGGADAISKINTLRCTLTTNMQNMDIKMESVWSRAGGRMSKTTMPMGEIVMASDGKIGWMKSSAGYMLLTDAQVEELGNQAGIIMNLLDPITRMKESATAVEVAGKQVFAGKECHRLHATRKGGKQSNVFYDVASGLPVGGESIEIKNDQEIRTRTLMSDWQEEQGVKVFRAIDVESPSQAGGKMALKVTSVEINKADDATFAVPEEVKKLVEARDAGKPADAPAGEAGAAKEIQLSDLTVEQRDTATKALESMKKSGDVEAMKRMVQQIEPVLGMMPADQQPPMKYVLQEMRKEIARLGG